MHPSCVGTDSTFLLYQLFQGQKGRDGTPSLSAQPSGAAKSKPWPATQAGVSTSLIMPPAMSSKSQWTQSSQFRSLDQFIIPDANRPSWNRIQRQNHFRETAKFYVCWLQEVHPARPTRWMPALPHWHRDGLPLRESPRSPSTARWQAEMLLIFHPCCLSSTSSLSLWPFLSHAVLLLCIRHCPKYFYCDWGISYSQTGTIIFPLFSN